jgi:hypothetical protein
MTLARYQGLCIDVGDARVSGEYWSTMLGWRLEVDTDGDARPDARLYDDAGRVQVRLNVVPEPKTVKNRVHLDVNAESVQRALDAGARVLEEFPRWTMMADPDGQEHCVFVRDRLARRPYELGWDCAEGGQAHELAVWWAQALGGAAFDNDDEGFSWVQDIPGCPWDSFDYAGVPEPKTVKNRVHIDVETPDLDALVAHGARVLSPEGDGGPARTVLADPAGNEFCAFSS